ncbi:hypothetical protein D7Z26_22100 [Cohnella endophytica]|uniref:Uncharacterized protein n=1 Tax=Cohnella endophytica TaxID=2419778 RepID=A0A494XIA4_9BACL|nr:hypothetical protein D7Z26_22100 [Cohnella endophytica]
MATKTRGNVLLQLEGKGRGECPLCARTGIKLLYDGVLGDGTPTKVCKYCRPKKQLKKAN